MESHCFPNVPFNPFRILLFRKYPGSWGGWGYVVDDTPPLREPRRHRIKFCGKLFFHWTDTMAHRSTLEAEQPPKSAKPANQPSAAERRRGTIFDAFRRWGYYESTLDPIALFKPLQHPVLAFTGPIADEARGYYCGTIGAEFMHLPEPERRQWIAEQLETTAPQPDQVKILERLIRADLFEQVLQARYLGAKRFSLEG